MDTSMILPFDEKDLLKDLPAERSETEIVGEYRTLFAECMKEYDLAMGAPCRAEAADLTVSLVRGLKDGFLRFAKWVDTLIPEFDVAVPRLFVRDKSAGQFRARQCTFAAFVRKTGRQRILED